MQGYANGPLPRLEPRREMAFQSKQNLS